MGFRGVGYQRVAPDSDELVCSYASEGFIDYLNYLHSLFAEGIITDDFMTTGKEYGNWESSYYSGKVRRMAGRLQIHRSRFPGER